MAHVVSSTFSQSERERGEGERRERRERGLTGWLVVRLWLLPTKKEASTTFRRAKNLSDVSSRHPVGCAYLFLCSPFYPPKPPTNVSHALLQFSRQISLIKKKKKKTLEFSFFSLLSPLMSLMIQYNTKVYISTRKRVYIMHCMLQPIRDVISLWHIYYAVIHSSRGFSLLIGNVVLITPMKLCNKRYNGLKYRQIYFTIIGRCV